MLIFAKSNLKDMKKIIITLLLAITATTQSIAQEFDCWDMILVPKVGVNYSNFTKLDGEFKTGFYGAVGIEFFLNTKFAVDTEISFSRVGAHNVPTTLDNNLYDYRLTYISTDHYLRWYPTKRQNLSLFAGVHMGRLIRCKANLQDIRDELRYGDVTFPVGVGYRFGKLQVEGRVYYPLRKIADTEKADAILGNAGVMNFQVNVGYRINIF